jgi:hypothetical protein
MDYIFNLWLWIFVAMRILIVIDKGKKKAAGFTHAAFFVQNNLNHKIDLSANL